MVPLAARPNRWFPSLEPVGDLTARAPGRELVMCGIAGSIGSSALFQGEGPDLACREVMAHRGPDDFGWWLEEGVSLLHWRLSIIDLSSAAHQPMISRDGRFVICYNGEVYNFEELRGDIERTWQRSSLPDAERRDGDQLWRSRSDTEVILEGFALWGVEFLRRLNGIFAIALYDRQLRQLHLARDRAGVKPLYVYERDGTVLFASEAKFFFHARSFAPAIDARGLAAFFTYGVCYGEHHVLAGVRQVEPGEVLTYDAAGAMRGASLAIRRHRLCPPSVWSPVRRPDDVAARQLKELLSRVVARQLVADVPVGVLLSGGVDSSILTALIARILGATHTHAFTLGHVGMGSDYDEIAHARRVAEHLGVQHHVYEATQDDLIHDVERLVWHYDEPFADAAALNVFVLSRFIRSRVTVALAGEGSDELFGGYRRYHLEKLIRSLGPIGRALSTVVRATRTDRVPGVPRRLQVVLRALAERDAPARYSSYLQGEARVGEILRPEWRAQVGVNPSITDGYPDRLEGGTVGHLCLVDQAFWLPCTYLEKSDKGGMAHSLEIRVPFLDNEVVAFANTLPDSQRIRGRRRKWLLREAFGDMLPGEVFSRFKRGFGVPVGSWFRQELRAYYGDQVLSPGARLHRYVQTDTLEAAYREHVQGTRDYSGLLWQSLVLEIWLRHFERGFAKRAGGAPPAAAPADSAA